MSEVKPYTDAEIRETRSVRGAVSGATLRWLATVDALRADREAVARRAAQYVDTNWTGRDHGFDPARVINAAVAHALKAAPSRPRRKEAAMSEVREVVKTCFLLLVLCLVFTVWVSYDVWDVRDRVVRIEKRWDAQKRAAEVDAGGERVRVRVTNTYLEDLEARIRALEEAK